MQTITGYHRNDDGTLARCSLLVEDEDITGTMDQPAEADDIRRPREIGLLIAQLAQVAGLELRQLRTGDQPTNEQLRRAYGVAMSLPVAVAELDGGKACPGGHWPRCEGYID